MGRGGKRTTPDGAYNPNRSDLASTPQPIRTAPGQPYGEAGAQQAQQAAMPLQNGGGAVAPGAAPAGAPPDPGLVAGGLGQSLFDPSQRPGEPVTHGAASGPGAGPEALQQGLDVSKVSTMLQTIAQASGSSDIAVLAQHAASLGQ